MMATLSIPALFSPEVKREFLSCDSDYATQAEPEEQGEGVRECDPTSTSHEGDSLSKSESGICREEVAVAGHSKKHDAVRKADKLEYQRVSG